MKTLTLLLALLTLPAFGGEEEWAHQNDSLKYSASAWHLNEGSGTIIKDAGGFGLWGGFQSPNPVWTNGVIGGALRFAGTSVVEITNATPLNPTTAITIGAWVKNEGAVPANGGGIVMKQSNGFTSGYGIRLNSGTSAVNFVFVTSSGLKSFSTTGLVGTNAWHNVVATYDSSSGNCYIYLDGALDASSSTTGTLVNSTNGCGLGGPNVAGVSVSTSYLIGAIDNPVVVGRAWTAGEVKKFFGGGYGTP